MKDILIKALALQPEIVRWRREVHQKPEPSWHEEETARFVERELRSLGFNPARVAGTGVVADIGTEGPLVALRADIDALEIQEQTGLPYASRKPGLMHACGHDSHTAMLLGAARILAGLSLPGRVRLIFQPAEELAQGAPVVIRDGAMQEVKAIFGMHIWADLPAGVVNIEAGPRMASSDTFSIKIHGKGGHGSAPHQGVDAIVAGAQVITALQTLVSREIDTQEPAVVSIGKAWGGERFNIIASEFAMEGTTRTFSPEVRGQFEPAIRRIAEGVCAAHRSVCDVAYTPGCPAVVNAEEPTAWARAAAADLLGAEALAPMRKVMGSEDFSFYGEKAPAVFAFLGGGVSAPQTNYPHHNAKFAIEENVFYQGTALYAGFAVRALAKLSK